MKKPAQKKHQGFTLVEILIASGMFAVLSTFALVMLSQAGKRAEHLRVMMYALTDTQRLNPLSLTPPPLYAGRIPLDCKPEREDGRGYSRIHLSCDGPRREIRVSRTFLKPSVDWGLE